MKKLLFIFLTFLAVNASAQIPYETSVFWQFLEGFQGGDSSTQNYLEYKNDFLLLKTDERDAKVLQVRNELNDIGISTIFIDANGNGGFSIDSAGGQTVIKLRGALNDHSYLNNTHVSVGRGGQTQAYGGNVDGAQFTVNDGARNPFTGLGSADNYQMMVQSSSDLSGEGAGIAFNNENAAKDINVGGAIVYEKLGNNGYGALEFYAKDNTTDLAAPTKYIRMANDTLSILATNVIGVPNIYTADGTLTGDRAITSGGFDLSFDGNLGIGTSSPSASLHIIGSEQCNLIVESTVTGAGIDFVDNTTSAYNQVGIGALGDNLCFRAGGVLNMRLTAAGDLGIGTSSPSARLHADNTETTGVGAIIENSDVANTDDIAQFQNSTGTVASITNDGGIVASIPSGTSDTSLVISNDTVYKRVAPIIETGTYTPTFTDSLNTAGATTSITARYNRVGNSVDVYLYGEVNLTSTGVQTIIGISLPVASDFNSIDDAIGHGVHAVNLSTNADRVGMVTADVGGDKVYFEFIPGLLGIRKFYVEFTYIIK